MKSSNNSPSNGSARQKNVNILAKLKVYSDIVVGCNIKDVSLKSHVRYIPWALVKFHGCHEAIIEMTIGNDGMSSTRITTSTISGWRVK